MTLRIELSDAHQVLTASRSFLQGNCDVAIVRKFLSPVQVAALWRAFGQVVEDTKERNDVVRARNVGPYHYGKRLEDYIEDHARSSAKVRKIFECAGVDPLKPLVSLLSDCFSPATVRPARYANSEIHAGRAIEWTGDTPEYLLGPHDDCAQLTDPQQAGFEIQECSTARVIAFNVYSTVLDSGGALRVWDCPTTPEIRINLGLSTSGYPYPNSFLADYPYIDLTPLAGDLLMLDGRLVHAVTAGTGGHRLLFNMFAGETRNGEYIYWT